MNERVGWRLTSDVIGILCVVFALLYFCLAGGVQAVRETHHRMRSQKLVGGQQGTDASSDTAKTMMMSKRTTVTELDNKG